MNHPMIHRHATVRWPALVAIGAAALLGAACTPRDQEKPAAPDGAAQPPVGPPYGPGPGGGRGPGPGGGRGPGPGMGPGGGPGAMCAMGAGPLTDEARDAVLSALEDERKAEAAYTAVIAQFGSNPPFSRIQRAEQRHAAALERILTAHGVPIPAEKPAAAAPRYADVAAACRAGVESEKANIAVYDSLSKVALPDDVKCVFGHLRAASETRHLPAFQSCSGAP